MSQRRQARGTSVTMSWDDTWLYVERNGRRMHLSPTQYRICRAFLPDCIPVTLGDLTLMAYRSCRQLQEETQLSREALVKQISRANTAWRAWACNCVLSSRDMCSPSPPGEPRQSKQKEERVTSVDEDPGMLPGVVSGKDVFYGKKSQYSNQLILGWGICPTEQ